MQIPLDGLYLVYKKVSPKYSKILSRTNDLYILYGKYYLVNRTNDMCILYGKYDSYMVNIILLTGTPHNQEF